MAVYDAAGIVQRPFDARFFESTSGEGATPQSARPFKLDLLELRLVSVDQAAGP
jgi:hypothetical protein